ncbi:unnamed protein product [Rotaria magnacalcarata]|uniref:Uncharacterized protein n=1 Tax=Rotaria magnacalcarata TaxID=392030 RepID=A0A815XRS1_9BILA|nr:unnamed protein product [Rotaria magnacalcarata]
MTSDDHWNQTVCGLTSSDKDHKQLQSNELMEKKTKFKQVSFFNLFRFANRLDITLLILGLVAAFGNGAVGPLMLFFLAGIIGTFFNQPTSLCKLNYTAVSIQYCEPGILLTSTNYIQESSKCNLSEIMNQTVLTTMFRQQLHYQSLCLIVIGSVSFVLTFIQTSLCSVTCEHQTRRLREQAFRILLKKSISYFDTHTTGELTTILNSNIDKIHDGIGNKLGLLVQLNAKLFISLVLAFFRGWKMTMVILSLVPLIWLISIISSKISRKLFAQELKAYARAGAIAEEVFSNIRVVFAFNGIEHEQARYKKHIETAQKQGVKKGAIAGIFFGSMYFILFGSHALAFWYGNHLIHNEGYDIANVIFIFFAVLVGIFSLGQSAPYRESINEAKAAAVSVWDIFSSDEKNTRTSDGKIPNVNFLGNVKFDNVFFSYPSRSDISVLHGLSFEAIPGQTLALVGTSGCGIKHDISSLSKLFAYYLGKSTCMQLIQQFYKPTSGQILLDDKPIECFDLEELRQKIGVVNQEPILFSTTILKNIQYGQPNATFADIQEASMAANAHNFIMSLPDKYDTIVGERGAQLSGGERQRIIIARALVRKPILLLLDEASSALDNQSEKTVQQALEKVSKGIIFFIHVLVEYKDSLIPKLQNRTTIIIAHRLSTVRHTDKIIVIDKGMVIEEGNHETLMKHQSNYYNLVRSQAFEERLGDNDDNDYQQQLAELTPFLDSNSSNSDDEMSVLRNDGKKTKTSSKKKTHCPSLAILKLNRPELILIIIGAFTSIFNGGFEPASSILLSEIIGVYQECDIQIQNKKIQLYVTLFMVLAIVIFITMFTQNYMFACSGEALTKRLRAKVFRAILRQEIAWFDHPNNNTGALCTRLSKESTMIQGVAGARIGTLCSSFANLGVGMIISFIFGWKLSLVALAFIPFMVAGGFLHSYLMEGYSNRDSKAFERAGSLAFQAFQNIRTVQQLVIETQFINDYCQLLDIPYRSSIRRVYIFGLIYSFTTSTTFFSMAAVFTYGGMLVEQNVMSFKNVMIVVNSMIFGAQSVGHHAAMAPDYGKAVSAARRMLELFAREPKISIDSRGLKLKDFTGDLQFRAVNFAYATRSCVPILNNFNLDIKSGQRVAIVGTSGNGKSTILHLVERFYDIQSGSVLIGSKDLRDVNLNWWRSQIAIVTQEPTLFNVSIAENFAYGDLSRYVTMDEIIEAAKSANIHDFIQQLPQGYHTYVGSKGDQLSGGQRQRIAIGRALIRNPKIVNEALTRAIIGRTSMVVAHRLSTIRAADFICVLHNGHIVESGTHHQLISKKGYYYKLSQCMRD